ncbi:MAG TPA: NADH-quinone oxidoreductase subunit J [bacterium]|jgi:NADH:ubiquinone oxidoreductase subunit 6 (subunit J)|nr:NADH-quinone oxidoreductase subunit J [bacterium]
MQLSTAIFYLCAGLSVFSAVRVVTVRNVFHAALFLALTLALLAVLYLLLNAEFVAVVQLLVYVGAVIVLIIFAVMLTAQIGDAGVGQTNRLAVPAALGCAALFLVLQKALLSAPWAPTEAPAPAAGAPVLSNLQAVGMSLLNDYVYPFELTALILFTALIGAVLIARKDTE